jgi:hypothetical protein
VRRAWDGEGGYGPVEPELIIVCKHDSILVCRREVIRDPACLGDRAE